MNQGNPKYTNRLAKEKSPYLLQHAHNPVDWHPWGEEAFAKAAAENKPVFLSIGYATCHWCHVMERESFENEAIAQLMNELFINIKVDREERPDIDQIYMTAIQAMTGGGGWPLSAFLTPDRKPFFGGTYFPPDARHGRPGFPQILQEIARLWSEEKGRVIASGEQLVTMLQQGLAPEVGDIPDESLLVRFYQQMVQSFDAEHGGFGGAPKFPRSETLSLLLRIHRRTNDRKALEMVEKTLDSMARGGMYDHVGGGFARYSTDERWLIPHFEKMLYDNALLSKTYLEAFQSTKNAAWENIARETLDYILRDMTAPEGGFYSAEDADSEGEEGKFYIWSAEELKAALNPDEWDHFKNIFPLSVASILDGKYVLHVDPNKAKAAWEQRFDELTLKILKKLYKQRAQRIRPLLDDKVLTSWNALMISAMSKAAQVLGDPRYLQAAQKAADFILTKLWDGTTLQRRWREGEARYTGSLDDYSFLVAALLDLYETDFDRRWFDAAMKIQQRIDELFWDSKDHGYFYTDASDPTLISRNKELQDGAVPAGASIAAMNLQRLYHFTMETHYQERWEQLFRAVSGRFDKMPHIAPALLLSLDFATDHSAEIVIAGQKEDPKVEAILQEIRQDFHPNHIIALSDTMDDKTWEQFPIISGKTPQDGQATLYICRDHSCQAPTFNWLSAQKNLSIKLYNMT